MVVTSQHDGTHLTAAHHFVELQRDVHTSYGVLVEDACLCANHEVVLLGVANPDPVVHVLSASFLGNAFHGGMVGLDEVFMLSAQAYPAEGTVAVVKEFGPHDVLHIGRPDEAVFLVDTVLGYLLYAGVIDGFHEGVAVVEEVGAACHQLLDEPEVAAKRLVDHHFKTFTVFLQQARTFLEGDACRTVSAFVDGVAGSLVAQQFDVDMVVDGILQQVDDVAVVGDGAGTTVEHRLGCQAECLGNAFGDMFHPPLLVAGLDA